MKKLLFCLIVVLAGCANNSVNDLLEDFNVYEVHEQIFDNTKEKLLYSFVKSEEADIVIISDMDKNRANYISIKKK
jgi:hypothetical protein